MRKSFYDRHRDSSEIKQTPNRKYVKIQSSYDQPNAKSNQDLPSQVTPHIFQSHHRYSEYKKMSAKKLGKTNF